MPDIIHRIGISAPADQVYNAISTIQGLAHWWTDEVSGHEHINGEIQFTFRSETGDIKGEMTMKVAELVPARSVRWKCINGPAEWIGTDLTFELVLQDGMVILLFGHRNWQEAVEFMAHCSTKWAVFLLSLREYVESGKGRPSPHDMKIDNWN